MKKSNKGKGFRLLPGLMVTLACPSCAWASPPVRTLKEANKLARKHNLAKHPESRIAQEQARRAEVEERYRNPPLGHHFVHNEYDWSCSYRNTRTGEVCYAGPSAH